MDVEQIYIAILKDTFTVNSLQNRVRILKNYLNKHFFSSREEPSLADIPSMDEDDKWLSTFDLSLFDSLKGDQIVGVISQLEQKLKQAKVLTLYLAFLPTADQLTQIGEKVRAEFGAQMIIDLKVNPDLVAGCTLVWNGVFKDYSLAGRISNDKQQILTLFKEYMDK